MKNRVCVAITVAILGALCWASVFHVRAQDTASYKIIVNKSNSIPSIDRTELARLFLKKKSNWSNGLPAMPVDQKLTSEIRKKFSLEILKKPISAVNAYWQQKIFSGRDIPPPQKSSDASVVLYVASNKGAVGYVSTNANIGRARVLKVTH